MAGDRPPTILLPGERPPPSAIHVSNTSQTPCVALMDGPGAHPGSPRSPAAFSAQHKAVKAEAQTQEQAHRRVSHSPQVPKAAQGPGIPPSQRHRDDQPVRGVLGPPGPHVSTHTHPQTPTWTPMPMDRHTHVHTQTCICHTNMHRHIHRCTRTDTHNETRKNKGETSDLLVDFPARRGTQTGPSSEGTCRKPPRRTRHTCVLWYTIPLKTA